jgi:hypothetical protein
VGRRERGRRRKACYCGRSRRYDTKWSLLPRWNRRLIEIYGNRDKLKELELANRYNVLWRQVCGGAELDGETADWVSEVLIEGLGDMSGLLLENLRNNGE